MPEIFRRRKFLLCLCMAGMLVASVPAAIGIYYLIDLQKGIVDIARITSISAKSKHVLDIASHALPVFTAVNLDLTPDALKKVLSKSDQQLSNLERVTAELRVAGSRFITKQHEHALLNAINNLVHSWREIREQSGKVVINTEKSAQFIDILSKVREVRIALSGIDQDAIVAANSINRSSFNRVERANIMISASIMGAALIGLMAIYIIYQFAHKVRLANEELLAKNEEIENLNVTLEDRIEQRTSELKVAHRELVANMQSLSEAQQELIKRERLSALGQVTATLSHELRNPLGAIRSSLHIIRKTTNKAELELNRPLDRIERSIARCDNLIGEFLEFTRSNNLSFKTLDASDFLNTLLDEQILPEGIKLTRHLPEPGSEIAIDPERFRRAIINLVDNAAQAIVIADIKSGEIDVSCRPHGNGSVICVRDNGPGIPDDVLERMFEPLFTTKSFGAGLGLPTVKQLVDHHHAELIIETEIGVGTTFSVFLPHASQVAAPSDDQNITGKAA